MNSRQRAAVASGTMALGALCVTTSACRPAHVADDAQPTTRPIVRVTEVRQEAPHLRLPFPGITRDALRGRVGFQVSGRIVRRAPLGTTFRAGEVIAEVANPTLEPTHEAVRKRWAVMRIRREQAEREALRVVDLTAKGLMPPEEQERAETRVAALRAEEEMTAAQTEEAHRSLAETRVVATFDGTVTATHRNVGELVQPGEPVLEISGLSHPEIEIQLPQWYARHLVVGQDVDVELTDPRDVRVARVHAIGRAAMAERLFGVVFRFVDESVAPGIAAEVQLPEVVATLPTVPLRAIVDPGGKQTYLFVVDDDVARRVPVALGALLGEWVQVRGEVRAGQRVVATGASRLLDGQVLTVLQ